MAKKKEEVETIDANITPAEKTEVVAEQPIPAISTDAETAPDQPTEPVVPQNEEVKEPVVITETQPGVEQATQEELDQAARKSGETYAPTPEQFVERVKDYILENFRGDQRADVIMKLGFALREIKALS